VLNADDQEFVVPCRKIRKNIETVRVAGTRPGDALGLADGNEVLGTIASWGSLTMPLIVPVGT